MGRTPAQPKPEPALTIELAIRLSDGSFDTKVIVPLDCDEAQRNRAIDRWMKLAGEAMALGVEARGAALRAGRGLQLLPQRLQVQFLPVRVGQGPVGALAFLKTIDMAHLQTHRRLLVPSVGFAFEEVAEKFLLNRDAVVGVEMRPVFQAVHLQPLLR